MTVYTHARGLTLQRSRGQERRDRRHFGSNSFHQGRQLPQRSFLWTPVPRMPPGEQGRGRSRLRQKTAGSGGRRRAAAASSNDGRRAATAGGGGGQAAAGGGG